MQQYSTDDTILATALSLCGVPHWIQEGNPVPQIMLYTPDWLRRLGYRDVKFVEACRAAFKKRESGMRIYQFQRCDTLERIVKEYRRLQRADAEAKREGRKDAGGITLQRPEPEDVAAIIYFGQRIRSEMLSNFDITTIMVSGEGVKVKREESPSAAWAERETGQFIGVVTGKYSAVSINASDEILREVRI